MRKQQGLLHIYQFACSNPCVKENHENHPVSDADIIVSIVVFYHPQDFFVVEGMNQDFRLFYIMDLLCQNLFAVTFPLSIGAETFHRFQQIIGISWLATSVLQRTDILFYMDRLQIFKFYYLIILPDEASEFVELFVVVLDR